MIRIVLIFGLLLTSQIAHADMTRREAVTAAQWMRQIEQRYEVHHRQYHHREKR